MKYESEYFLKLKKAKLPLLAVLEDMAQCAGYEVPIEDDGSVKIAIRQDDSGEIASEWDGDILARSQEEAEKIFGIIEKTAAVILDAEKIGGAIPLDRDVAEAEHRFYLEDYSRRDAEHAAQDSLLMGRSTVGDGEALADLGRELLGLGYIQGTWGNLSLRLSDKDAVMLVTPSGRSYAGLTGRDMIPVEIESGNIIKASSEGPLNKPPEQQGRRTEWQPSGRPTSEKDLHRLIYQKFPEINAIIHTHARGSSVYAAARKPINLENVVVPVAEFAPAGTEELAINVVEAMSRGETMEQAASGYKHNRSRMACLLANHGLVVCGRDMDEALSFCQEIEEGCEGSLNE